MKKTEQDKHNKKKYKLILTTIIFILTLTSFSFILTYFNTKNKEVMVEVETNITLSTQEEVPINTLDERTCFSLFSYYEPSILDKTFSFYDLKLDVNLNPIPQNYLWKVYTAGSFISNETSIGIPLFTRRFYLVYSNFSKLELDGCGLTLLNTTEDLPFPTIQYFCNKYNLTIYEKYKDSLSVVAYKQQLPSIKIIRINIFKGNKTFTILKKLIKEGECEKQKQQILII